MLKKSGFSMAELLLVIMIIGIVSAMGITITKHGTDKAYNLFFYNGYINLYNSMADIISEGSSTITANELNNRLGTGALPATGIITANNGITYQCNNSAQCTIITMTVPQRKTKSNPNAIATTRLQYVNNPNNILLIPISDGTTVDLQNRRDLLPVYIDDGVVGRVKFDGSFAPIQYRSYNEAYCELGKPNITNVITCNSRGNRIGVIKFADPRKAH